MTDRAGKEKRIFKNTVLLYFRMAFSMLLGIYTSRLVLDAIGVSDYGIYNVVGGITTMFLFLNGSMSVSTSRFITYELGKDRDERLAKIYNQAVLIHRLIALLVFILVETVGLWFLNYKMNIPADRMIAANCVLQTVAVSSVLNVIATPDMALIISHERMKSFAFISILGSVLHFLFAFLLLSYHHDRLILYAILVMTIQVVIRLSYLIYCKRNFEESRTPVKFNKVVFKNMISFAGWNVLGNLALISIDQGINILLNIFFGPIVNAARGIAMQISNYSNTFITNIRMAINPQITKSYAYGDHSYMLKLITYSSLSCFYVLLLIAAFLFWILEYVLEIWLVVVPENTALFINLTLLYMMVNSFANPIIIGIHSTGKIRKFQVVEGCLMLLTLPLAYLMLKTGMPAYSVYISQIAIAIVSQIGRLSIVLPALNIKLREYLTLIILPSTEVLIVTALPSVCIYLCHLDMSNLAYSLSQCIVTTISCLLAITFIGLKKEERLYIFDNIRKKMHFY